jgi:hypothetical protein
VQERGLIGWVCALIALLALAGCDDNDETTASTTSTSTTSTAQEPKTTTPAEADRPEERIGGPVVYFTAGEQFARRGRPLGRQPEPARVLDELLAGPTASERAKDVRTQIPPGVELEDVDIAGGTATVDLSADFTEGIPAAKSARTEAERQELNARIGQLTYTLTELDEIRSVRIVAGGQPVDPAVQRAAFAAPDRGPQRLERPRGAKSTRALRAQKRLAQLRFLPGKAVDGVYGYRTEQAVIAFQAWNGLTRDGVVGPLTTAALETAKRPKPGNSGPARRIEVYRELGVALLVNRGKVKRAIHVSTGAPGTPTPAGTYEVFRKELRSWSVPFQVWLPYASYFNNGIAFHEYADVPPFPASHGCVRVPVPEAKGVYRFADVGTAVVVR